MTIEEIRVEKEAAEGMIARIIKRLTDKTGIQVATINCTCSDKLTAAKPRDEVLVDIMGRI